MLQKLNPQAAYCLQQANENHLKAEREVNAERRAKYLEMAWRWDYLAKTYADLNTRQTAHGA
jgi:hypothetical protein